MATAELTEAQAAAVESFGQACAGMFEAMAALETEGVDMRSALEALPGSEDGKSLYDELPGTLKMMI